MVDGGEEVGDGEDFDAPGPGGFSPLGRRADEAEVSRAGGDGGGEDAGDLVDRAVQRQFAEGGVSGKFVARQDVHGGEHGQRDREVEVAAFFQQVGRGEVDQHPFGREGEAHGGEGGANAFAGLADGLVRQADDEEGGDAGCDLHLHLHRDGVDAAEGEAADAGDHCERIAALGLRTRAAAWRDPVALGATCSGADGGGLVTL